MIRSEIPRSEFKRPTPSKEPKPPKGARMRKCAVKTCRSPFKPCAPMVSWCSPDCGAVIALERVAKQQEKAARAKRVAARLERAEDKKKLEQHKKLAYWLKKTEKACNEFIRARDPDICISCGVTSSSAWQAGHYISVGACATLRFHEDNIHKQCIHCNMFKGSNATEYRLGLLEKIGPERVEWLESWHPPVHMTREAAQEIEAYFKAKLKSLKETP